MFICALVSVPTWAFFMFLGTALWVFFQHFPSEAAAQVLDGSAKAEEILPHFITNYLPHGLIGLVIAAAIAARPMIQSPDQLKEDNLKQT